MKTTLKCIALAFALGGAQVAANEEITMMSSPNVYQFSFIAPDGEAMPLAEHRDKVILVVNTASQCGFTPQYAGLQQLHERFGERGLVVIGVPSDNFGGQELDSSEEVKAFIDENFSITFPLASITNVSGSDKHPFYGWAREQTGILGGPKWNFHKYLIDREGNLAESYSSLTKPTSAKLVSKIEELLATSAD